MQARFFQLVGVDEDVFDLGSAEDFQVLSQSVVNEVLEVRGSVGETEWHYQVCEMAEARSEGSLPFLPLRHLHQLVASSEVQLCYHLAFKSLNNGC